MAVLIRTTQAAEFCHVGDLAVVKPGIAAPDPDWVLSEGQPPDATRFRVRPLSESEYTGMVAMDPEARDLECCRLGLVSVDGQPPDLSSMAYGWPRQIANLVVGVTLRPLAGRISRLEAEASKAGSGGTPSPE